MYYVYRFLDKSKNIIYVGKSKQELEQRFKGHKHLPDKCYSSVHKIEFISCSTETDMNIKEIYYINKYNNGNGYFNLLDLAEIPKSVEFNDKWKMYRGALPSHFSKSLNYKNGYSSQNKINYTKEGSIDKRKNNHKNHKKGKSDFVEPLTSKEVDLIIDYFIDKINSAKDNNKKQIWFRNLTMFVVGVNLPLKPEEFLSLEYKDIFDKKDQPQKIKIELGRYYKDDVIYIPLKKVVSEILIIYRKVFNLTFSQNSDEKLFKSREGNKNIESASWIRILKEATEEVKINKNIAAESIRKTYGFNIYKTTRNKLKALLFLGELWGQIREVQLIKYLNLEKQSVDFDYFFSEKFALGNVDFKKIEFINIPNSKQINKKQPSKTTLNKPKHSVDKNTKSNKENITSTKTKKTNPRIDNTKKLEIINEYLKGTATQKELSKKYNITLTTISRWVQDYLRYGDIIFK